MFGLLTSFAVSAADGDRSIAQAVIYVCVGASWKAEHNLSERLLVYRSVDSLVDFDILLLYGDSR